MSYTAGSFSAGQVPTTAIWNQLWANDAAFNSGTGFASNVITYALLNANAFGATVQSYTPTITPTQIATSAPHGWYVNLGGIKIAWGTVGYSYLAGQNFGRMTVTLPVGFFSAIQMWFPAIDAEGGSPFQVASGDGISNVNFGAYVSAGSQFDAGILSFLVVGT